MPITTLEELKNYYPGRLILQYRDKPRWTSLIQAIVQEAWIDGIIQTEAGCFDLETAVGEQLDIIGRIVGVNRQVYGLDLTHTYFEATEYTPGVAGSAMQSYADATPGPEIMQTYRTDAVYTMSEFEMRTLIKLKIIYNNAMRSTKGLTDSLWSLFGNNVQIKDNSRPNGIDEYDSLMLHLDNNVTDSSLTPKTVTNNGVLFSNTVSKFGGYSGYFPGGIDSNTKLMLHLDNNITDSETSPKTVTNNNVTFSSSVSKFGGYGAVFNGSNAYLGLADNNDFKFDTGDFTIDTWMHFDSITGFFPIFYRGATGAYPNSQFSIQWTSAGGGQFVIVSAQGSGVTAFSFNVAWSPSINNWYHIAVVRSSGVITIYINGISIGSNSAAGSTLNSGGTNVVQVGATSVIATLNCILDEYRVSNTARWTSNFTPHSDAYTCSYLSIPDSNDWDLGTNDFTIDCWIYPKDLSEQVTVLSQYANGSNRMYVIINPNGLITFGYQVDGVWKAAYVSSAGAIIAGVFQHIAIVRNGTDLSIYVNGISLSLSVITAISTNSLSGISYPLEIGTYQSATQSMFYGYIDEVRISKGIARWTSNFTPPTANYDAGVSMNLSFNVKQPYYNVFIIAAYLGLIPKPMGVSATINYI